MGSIGRTLITVGILLVAIGALFLLASRVPLLGRLPGDIRIERPGVRFYFPLATSLLLSIVVSLVVTLVLRLRR